MVNGNRSNRYSPSSENFSKEDFPFYWVARLNNMYTHQMENDLRKVGADVPTWRVLEILRENGTSSMSDISIHAVVKLSTMTKIVYRMKAEGLVATSTSAQDGRVTEVSLTKAGEKMIKDMHKVTERIFDRSFKGLSSAKIDRLNQLLAQIFNNLSD